MAAFLILAGAPACFIQISPLDDDYGGSGTTGDPDPQDACVFGGECNGVFMYCKNNNVGGGADETGGDGGPAANYWWVPYSDEVPNPVALCTDDAGDENDICCVEGCGVGLGCCYIKQYDEPGNGVPSLGNTVRVCLGDGTPVVGLDPLADTTGWVGGNYPAFDDEIRTECSARCSTALDKSGAGQDAPPLCEDDQWSGLQTGPSWHPDQGYNCLIGAELNLDDPDGSDIPWHRVGGSSAPAPLDCNLNGDCVDWFYPGIGQFVLATDHADFIDPETRTAHYLGVENSGSGVELQMNMSGSGAGVDDREPLFGMAEYTAMDCVDAVCPFFLANLTAYNTTDTWEVRLDTDISTRINKSVSNVQIDLVQSTLGVRHMALGKVAFAPGALRLHVQVEITANGGSTYGDGVRSAVIENVDYVFADYDDGALELTHTFPVQSGQATLILDVVPDEYPPVAEHDLASTESCNAGTGHLLDASHILSSDPDDDIVVDLWWIDGMPCSGECVLPVGTHEVSLEARDARGAVHRTAEQWVVVPPCT